MSRNERSADQLRQLIIDLKDTEALALVEELLAQGHSPADLLDVFRGALVEVGRLYEAGEYFIIGLIMAGELMMAGMDRLLPALKNGPEQPSRGVVLVGTIEGDIHDLGKNQTAHLLAGQGFEIIDLGVDVPPGVFWGQALVRKPLAIGVSVMMRGCLGSVQKMIRQLRIACAGQSAPPIFISGGAVSQDSYRRFGADHYVADAFEALDLCLRLSQSEG